MKQSIFSLIMLLSLTFSNVGFALSDVTTQKEATEFTVKAETPNLVYNILELNVDTSDYFGIYEVLNTQAPEVFTNDAGGTKVTLYGKHKDDAYKYLTEQKNGKNIYKDANCFKDVPIAFSICRSKLVYKDTLDNKRIPARYISNLSTSGQINSISKKWIRSI